MSQRGRAAAASTPSQSMGTLPAVATAAASTLLLAWLGVVVLTPTYMTNDDIALRSIVEGLLPGGAGNAPHLLLFANVLVGELLAALYRLDATIAWYDGVFLALTLCAALVIWSTLYEASRGIVAPLTVFVLVLPWLLVYVYRPQFSMTAALLALAAVMLLLSALLRRRAGPGRYLLAAVLAVLAALLRLDAAALLLLTGSLVALPLLPMRRPGRLAPVLLTLAAVLAVVVAASRYDHAVYHDTPGYAALKTLNADRARIQEYGLHPAYLDRRQRAAAAQAVAASGLGATRLALLEHWVSADAAVDAEQLRASREALAPYREKWRSPVAALRQFRDVVFYELEEMIPCLLLAVLAALAWPRRLAPWVLLWALSVFAVAYFAIFFVFKLPPYRVYYPLLTLAAMGTVLAGLYTDTGGRRRLPVLLLAGAIVLGLLGAVRQHNLSVRTDAAAVLARLDAFEAGPRYLATGSTLPMKQLVLPFAPARVLPRMRLVSTGWTSFLPGERAALLGTQPHGNIVDTLCRNDTRLLESNRRSSVRPLLVTYARETLSRAIAFTATEQHGPLTAYRCQETFVSTKPGTTPPAG